MKLIVDYTTCCLHVACTPNCSWMILPSFISGLTSPSNISSHILRPPEERHFFSQLVAMPSSSSDLLCYFKVALDDYPPVFYLAFVTIDSVAQPHLPEDSSIPHSVLCWLQEVEEYEMGQQVERRWGAGAPRVGNLLCIQKSFKSTQCLLICLIFLPFLPLSDFSFWPHTLPSHPTSRVNLRQVWFGYVIEDS